MYTSVYLSEPYDVCTHTAVTSHSFSLLEWPQCTQSYSVHCSSGVFCSKLCSRQTVYNPFKRQWKSNPKNDNFYNKFRIKTLLLVDSCPQTPTTEVTLDYILTRYHSRFFVQVGHETTYAAIGNHYITLSSDLPKFLRTSVKPVTT